MSNLAFRNEDGVSHDGPFSRLVIHLDAIARNYLYLKKKLVNGADCAAVVKSDAYGLGVAQISQELFAQGCRHFFVAQIDEALELKATLPPARAPGEDTAIYILNGPHGAAPQVFMNPGLVPVLNTLGDIEYWAAAAKQAGRKLPAVVHIDTGMNRLGLSASDVTALVHKIDLLKALDIRYVMSHLACSDEPQHPKNAEQLKLFKTLSAQLNQPFRYSFANSGGIFLGADYQFDLVRPGAAIYGINTTGTPNNPMQAAVTLQGRILQTRATTEAGSVGYGAEYTITPPAKCATISVGYADGVFRTLGNRGHVFIDGKKCPMIGRVSMDCIVVDTTLLERQPDVGSFAEIIGANQSVDDLAAAAGTIGYEILTGLGKRLNRIFEGTTT